MSARATRREALAGGAALAAGVLLPASVAGAKDDKQLSADLLAKALQVELTSVVAYEAIANSGRAGEHATLIFRQLLDQERQHVESLTEAVEQLGAKPPQAPRRAEIRGLGRVRSQASAVRFAIALEQGQLGAYSDAILELTDANAIRIVATIVGAEGGHLVLLRELAGRPPLASAFESGTP
jgi:rubrerythrin